MSTETVTVTCPPCPFCGKSGEMDLPADGLASYLDGGPIVEAFPGLNAGQREQVMTGIHPACWDRELGEEET